MSQEACAFLKNSVSYAFASFCICKYKFAIPQPGFLVFAGRHLHLLLLPQVYFIMISFGYIGLQITDKHFQKSIERIFPQE